MKRLSTILILNKFRPLFSLFIFLSIIHSNCVFAQEFSVGINNDDPNPNAALHISSPNGDQGLIIPLLTSSGRAAMSLAAEDKGLLVFDADQSLFYYWSGREWIPLSTSDAQQITLAGNSLSISNGNTVDLSAYLDNTDNQNAAGVEVTPSGNLTSTDVQAALEELQTDVDNDLGGDMAKAVYDTNNDGTVNSADDAERVNGLTVQTAVPANADFSDDQELNLAGNTLSITDGNTVNLSAYLDNTDDQNAAGVEVTPSGSLTSTDVQAALVELQTDVDNDLGGDMTKAVYDTDNNGIVDNAATVNSLTVETAVPANADFSDDQTAAEVAVTPTVSLAANNVQDALEELQTEIDADAGGDMTKATYDTNNDGTVNSADDAERVNGLTVETAVPANADFSDDQNLNLDAATNNLSITDGNNVDLSAYLDNTDDQTATEVTVTAQGNLTSTDVQAALVELQTDVDNDLGGDMTKAVYDTDNNGIVDNAATVNSLTVQTAVPANADFSDDQELNLAGNTLSITDGNNVDLSPYLDNTDDQELSLAGNTLSITDGNNVDLSAYLDNTDDQNLNLDAATNTLSITDGNNVDLSAYLDNTDDQELSLAGNTLSITDGNNVDLSAYLDNTDDQNLNLDAATNTLSITDGNNVDLSPYLDNTDDQELSLAGNTLSITDGNNVDLSTYLDNTDDQNLNLDAATNNLSITDGNNVDLSAYLDNTDDQNLNLDAATNTLSITDGNTVDLSPYLDNTDNQNAAGQPKCVEVTPSGNLTSTDVQAALEELQTDVDNDLGGDMAKAVYDTDNNGIVDNAEQVNNLTVQTAVPANADFSDDQELNLAGNTLSITDGNNVDLSPYLDNTDDQNLNLDAATNTLSITDGNTVDLSAYLDNTDDQNLNLDAATNTLSITDGNNVDLSAYLDNTDDQELNLAGNTLSITDGNNVDLSAYLDNTDDQTAAQVAFSQHTGLHLPTGNVQTTIEILKAEIDADEGGDMLAASNLSDLADAATARTNLGLTIGTDVQAHAPVLDDVSGLDVADGNFMVGDGTGFVVESGDVARESLGLGTAATADLDNLADVTVTGNLEVTGNINGPLILGVTNINPGGTDYSRENGVGFGPVLVISQCQDAGGISSRWFGVNDPGNMTNGTTFRVVNSSSCPVIFNARAGIQTPNPMTWLSLVPGGIITMTWVSDKWYISSNNLHIVQYTVSFDANEGSAVNEETVNHGSTATEPTAPTRPGYTFDDWYTDSGLSSRFDFDTPITEYTTLYAQWTINTYTVTFDANEGSAINEETVNHGSTATEPTAPTRPGYTFDDWYTDRGLSSRFDFDTPITGYITLYAKWISNITHTVSFDTDGEEYIGPQTVNNGEMATRPRNPNVLTFARTFRGWYTDNGTFNDYFDFSSRTITSDITLYARWGGGNLILEVRFNTNGGCGMFDLQMIDYGNRATEPTIAPTREGFRFGGWYTDNTIFSNEYDFSLIIQSDLTLYAQWIPDNTYSVNFINHGGNPVAAQTIRPGNRATQPPAQTARYNQVTGTFGGWYTDEDFTTEFNFSSLITNKDITLYGKWEYTPADKAQLLTLITETGAFDENITINLNFINTSNITDMSEMFDDVIFNADISKWDVSNVTNMRAMFNETYTFNQDISDWDVSNVTNMSYMFSVTDSFNQDISNWDVSNVTNMDGMFWGAENFNQDISNWDVSNVTNMRAMFRYSDNFNQDLSSWDVRNVMNFENIFDGSAMAGEQSKWPPAFRTP